MNTDGHNPGLDLRASDEPNEMPQIEELPITDSLSEEPGGLFRLINIHLIDSLSRGRVQTMGIDGGMALTGRNGRGKTSLLSLALLFVGVEPRDVVSQGKDSFIDYYLPNQTSYIVYEYERPGGSRRLVVVLSNVTADKVRFRFVKSHFRREMFVTEDGQFVLNKDFRQRLIQLKIQHADKLVDTYIDYRAIIQCWQPPHADPKHRNYLRGLSDEYGFTKYNRPLRHLEKLTKGMFSRKANFDDLQQVVADWVFEGKPSAGIQTERKRVESWPQDYSAYQNIMGISPLLEVARSHRDALEASEDGMREVKEKFILLREHLVHIKSQRESEQQRKEAYLKEEETIYDESSRELTRAIEGARADVDNCERNLEGIEKARQHYESQEVESKRSKAAQKEVIADELRSTEALLGLALGAASDIKAEYDKQINEEHRRHNEFQAAAFEKTEQLREDERQSLAEVDATYQDSLKTLKDSSADEQQHLLEEQQRHHAELGRAQERVTNPPIDSSIKLSIDEKTLALRDASKAITAAQSTVIEREREVASLQSQSHQHDQVIEAILNSISQQQKQIEEIQRANTPEKDSLLAFLRTNRPDWANDIAKVINPSLLHRTDLHPQLAALSESFYGVAVDLEFLDPVDEADESRLHEILNDAHQALEAYRAQHQRAVDEQTAIRQSLKAAGDHLTLARSGLLKAKSAAQVLEREVDKLNDDYKEKLKEAQRLANEHLAECGRCLGMASQAYQSFTERLTEKQQSLLDQCNQRRQSIVDQFKNRRQEIQRSVEDHKRSSDASVQALIQQQNTELEGKGADINVIASLEDKIKGFKQELKDISSWADLLSEWQIWTKQTLPQIPLLQARKESRQADFDRDQLRVVELAEAWHRKRELVGTTIAECRSVIAGAEAQLVIVTDCLEERLAAFDPTNRHEAYSDSWEANDLRATVTALQKQISAGEYELRKLTSKMRNAFHEELNAAPSTYFQDRLQNLRAESGDEVDARMTLRVVEDWFASEHEKCRRLLIADARTIFGEIQGLHRELQAFNKKISSFNSSLQEHLEHSSTVFDNLSELKISIYSAVEELDYWSVITKITNDREQWTQEDSLPSPESVAHLSALIAVWDAKRGISAHFKSLVSIRGSVREQGNYRQFRNRTELENISSNGLSYLVLIILFLGFIGKVRGNAPVQLTWCVDELKAIDAENIVSLCNYLGQNRITLCTAFPDPDAETLMLFEHKYKLDAERRLVHCELAINEEATEDGDLELAWEDGQ